MKLTKVARSADGLATLHGIDVLATTSRNETLLTGIGQLAHWAVPCFQLVSEATQVLLPDHVLM